MHGLMRLELWVFQALAGELGHAKEAERWLQEQTPWLDVSQRQGILADLQQTSSEQESARLPPPLQASTPAQQEDKVSWASPSLSKVPAHLVPTTTLLTQHCHAATAWL